MLTYTLEKQKRESLYEQLYRFIREDILSGRLHSGERLPSKRTLAQHLEVSTITVKNAYEQLQAEGYIHARQRCGYFVSEVERPPESRQTARPAQAGREREQGWFLDFASGTMDPAYFPFTVWARLMRQTLLEQDKQLLRAAPYNGAAELRRAIAGYLQQFRGMQVDPEQIIVGAGSEYLLMLLSQILEGRHVIAMENPTYKQAYRVFQSLGYEVCPVEMDANGMDPSILAESGANVAYVMPSHQFPTGVVMPVGRRQELLKWAVEEAGRYIIEDDYDSEFRYRGKPIPALQGMDRSGKVIYLGTFSKCIAPAIRVSYLVLPKPLLVRYRSQTSFYASTVSRIDQNILYQFLSQGYFERHLNRMRAIYKTKHDLLIELIEPLKEQFEIHGEHAGIHILLTSKYNRSEQELISLAAEAGVKVYGLSSYFIHPEHNHRSATVVLGYASLNEDAIREGVGILTRCWKEGACK